MSVEKTQVIQSPALGCGEVLIVDDDVTFCREALECFDATGYRCHYATSGTEAIDLININPDIRTVIVDLWMQDMGGLALIKRLRKLFHGSRQFKFLIVSGAAGMEDTITAFRLGVVDFILKPVSPLHLVNSVASVHDAALR